MKLASGVHRRRLWLGFAAVLVPLVILLVLQYRWLVQLDHTSAKAKHAGLKNYLEAVTGKIEWTYREDAERMLNLSHSIFTQDRLEKAAYHFKKKGVKGVKRLFVRSFASHPQGEVLYFDPSCSTFSMPNDWSPELRAVYAATAPWSILAHKGEPVERALLSVDERDPHYRVVLNPITDDASRVVGVAGMVLDAEYFQRLLPDIVARSLPKFFPEGSEYDLVVTVWDGDGKVVFANGPTMERHQSSEMMHASMGDKPDKGAPEVERAFSFVFTDYHIGLRSRHATPAQVAKRSFAVNIALFAALSTALLAGIVLALRTASREMKLSEMKSDFVSNVSHELRTPLASIRVFGEFLRLGRVENPDKVREYGEYIETESRRLTQLINNILDFASIESGRKSYRFESACLEEVVAETLKTFEVRLRQNGFQITYLAPEGPLPSVLLDAGAIAQSLSNLLDNAVKYSNGGREIQVAVRRDAGNSAWVIVSVRDQGIGIPKDEVDKIFDRFHRVSTGLVHDVKGSGLGLSIVRHIVEAHGGKLTVESRVGEGSTFSIWLPIEPSGPAARSLPHPVEA